MKAIRKQLGKFYEKKGDIITSTDIRLIFDCGFGRAIDILKHSEYKGWITKLPKPDGVFKINYGGLNGKDRRERIQEIC